MIDIDTQIDEALEECGILLTKYPMYKDRLKNIISKERIKARQTDEYGNPMIQLNMYEAEAVVHLIKNSDPNRFNTGDWFSDVPFKIEKRLAELKAPPIPGKGKE